MWKKNVKKKLIKLSSILRQLSKTGGNNKFLFSIKCIRSSFFEDKKKLILYMYK